MRIASQLSKGKFVKTTFDKHELTKHGVILGSTGSGKTGLGIKLIEELAVAGVPVIAIDPKGDLGNILDVPFMGDSLGAEGETAKSDWHRDKLIQKDITTRAKLKKVDATIYTPGVLVGGGCKLGIYGSSSESKGEYLKQVLSLAYGYEINSLATQYVFLESEVIYWEENYGMSFSLEHLIKCAMQPVTKKIGGMLLDDYISENERMTLARKLTSLAASKDFQKWEGELNVENLFWNSFNFCEGGNYGDYYDPKPRLSIISIAHMSEQDRKFFLPIFLSELVQTVRKWQGTDKLRAVLYIDECVGMVPSVSSPPTKTWLMTLLKQARAYGLGVVLATQNPADIDYKALGNIGSWWVGRLQTDRDRAKVGEALKNAGESLSVGKQASKGVAVNLGGLLGDLQARQFVQSVNGSSPILVKSNDCLCRLTGPMTLKQIEDVMHWKSPAYRVKYEKGLSEYALYRRMLIAGAKNATYGMQKEIDELRMLRAFIPNEPGYEGMPNFLWRKSIKPTLKARLRQVQDTLMQVYLNSAKKQLVKEKVG